MLIAIDIGNSNIKTGIWNGERWQVQERTETYPVLEADQYFNPIKQLLKQNHISPQEIETAVIGSVVPEATEPLQQALAGLLNIEPLFVNAALDTGIELEIDEPNHVGTDLIAGAAAAYELIRDDCIIVDLGTATTIMMVEKPGVLAGGAICIGLKTSMKSLIDSTAQLQQIPLEMPSSFMGQNTVEALQSGLIGGHLEMIEGIIRQLMKERGEAQVIATGGLVSILAPHSDLIDCVEPTLVLDGLRIIAERNK